MRPLVLSCLLVASFALAAPPKKKKVAPPKPAANLVTEAAIKKTLDGAEEKVGQTATTSNQ